MSALITIACVLGGVVIGWFAGYWQDHRRAMRRLPPPPIDLDELERLEPHHSTWCEWDEYDDTIWRCGGDCKANAWRVKNAGRPIVTSEAKTVTVGDLPRATVIELKKRP